jgi:hypothetical protein
MNKEKKSLEFKPHYQEKQTNKKGSVFGVFVFSDF